MEIVLTTIEDLERIVSTSVEKALDQQRNKENQKILLTFTEAVDYLGIAESTLHNWKSAGKIPFKRIGKRIYFNRDEILEALKPDKHFERMQKLRNGNDKK